MRRVDSSLTLLQLEAKRLDLEDQTRQLGQLTSSVDQLRVLTGKLRDLDGKTGAGSALAADTKLLAAIVQQDRTISRVVDELTDAERRRVEQDTPIAS